MNVSHDKNTPVFRKRTIIVMYDGRAKGDGKRGDLTVGIPREIHGECLPSKKKKKEKTK